jgi:DNA-binding NtrC family response regulator
VFGISREALGCLENYHWPGNVRELENTIERAIALETAEAIQIERLPDAVRKLPPRAVRDSFPIPEEYFDLEELLRNLEHDLICGVLRRTEGNQTLAANYLKLTKPSLRHRIRTLGIDPSIFRRNGSDS